MKKILAICGSTRSKSSNLNLIYAIIEIFRNQIEFELYLSIADLPHFNPDLDNECPDESVTIFRNKVKAADGVLICTPEYAMGVPGTLKNAIDWTVSSAEFSHKPVALITASSVGAKGHQSLLETLKIIECDIDEKTQLLIPFIKTKINDEAKITDESTKLQVESVIESLIDTIPI
jgi:NAD(P)H-dependent FMN reductase